MGSVIQRVFWDHFQTYRNHGKHSLRELKAGAAICECRTAVLGGHMQACPDGHFERHWYNSCKHRACPLCAFIQVERWIRKQLARLIACDYYHVIFTLPDALNPLWEFNRGPFTQLFFRAAWESLKELLADPKHLGAMPGALASFQSWGQTLWVHPHAHFLVTAGGMSPDGKWINSPGSLLLPPKALAAKFRGKFLALLRNAMLHGKLSLPPDLPPPAAWRLFDKLQRQKWHTQIQPRYHHGRGVLTYVGRYIKGGPISSRRIQGYDGQSLTIRFKDNKDTDQAGSPRRKTVELSATEFIQRFGWHVPPEGLHVIRSFGLFAPASHKLLNQARAFCGQLEVAAAADLSWQEICASLGIQHPERCPVCGRVLVSRPLSAAPVQPIRLREAG